VADQSFLEGEDAGSKRLRHSFASGKEEAVTDAADRCIWITDENDHRVVLAELARR
jgi:hypothetical protein